MAITKTNFIEYSRCKRYPALEQIKKDKLDSKMTLEEYKKEETSEEIIDILSNMIKQGEEEEIDLTNKTDIQLEAMLGYYKEVELEAAKICKKLFDGEFVYSENTYNQESFDYIHNGIRYLCYVDIYNQSNNKINIIEVKSTTSKEYLDLEYSDSKKEKHKLFNKRNNIYYLDLPINNDSKTLENYNKKISVLYNKYTDTGKYIYDLAIQRHIIENDLKAHNKDIEVNYYLAVLNHNYVYDGKEENNKRVYNEINGEEIVVLFNMNDITLKYQTTINEIRDSIENSIFNPDNNPCKVGKYCDIKSKCACKYMDVCFNKLPKYNRSYDYLGFRDDIGFTKDKYNKYDLINMRYYKLDDIPFDWIKDKPNMVIERDCYDNDKVFIDKEKIKAGLNTIKYPIYHLDFESFPCPMPRFKGENPYTQSCFEFSLHIERSEGVCDKDSDNYVFLASSSKDEREDMVKEIVKRIDGNNGTMLAQNVSFEKTRLKELSKIFPKYNKELMDIVDNSTDLLYFIRTNKELYSSLGFDKDRCSRVNYYEKMLSGSYSIKKTLPSLSKLSYSSLDIKNGTEALVAYSKFDHMSKEELDKTRENLIEYCKQDTWAMVVILDALRNLVK